jgi:hypothetical protein
LVVNRTIEDLLAESMRDEVAGLRPAPDLVARAARRHRQRSRIRLAASVTGSAGIAAAVAIGLTVASAGPRANGTGPSADQPGPTPASSDGETASSPRARLVAAMITSARFSYRLHLVNTSTVPGHRMTPTSPPRDLISWYADYTGVYNPRTGSGAGVDIMRQQSGTLADPSSYGKADGSIYVRILGDNYYTRFSAGAESWQKGRGTLIQALVLNGGSAWAPTDGASADPAVLLAALRRQGSVTFAGKNGTGAQALDTYDFKYDPAGDASVKPHQLTGTIVVHDQSSLIARITMQTRVAGSDPRLADRGWMTFKTVMTFSDYGVSVTVHAPTGAVHQLKSHARS